MFTRRSRRRIFKSAGILTDPPDDGVRAAIRSALLHICRKSLWRLSLVVKKSGCNFPSRRAVEQTHLGPDQHGLPGKLGGISRDPHPPAQRSCSIGLVLVPPRPQQEKTALAATGSGLSLDIREIDVVPARPAGQGDLGNQPEGDEGSEIDQGCPQCLHRTFPGAGHTPPRRRPSRTKVRCRRSGLRSTPHASARQHLAVEMPGGMA